MFVRSALAPFSQVTCVPGNPKTVINLSKVPKVQDQCQETSDFTYEQCCQYGDFSPRFEEFRLVMGNFCSDLGNSGS